MIQFSKGEEHMDTQNLAVGHRIENSPHGPGTVTFVGTESIGITFDTGGELLIRRDELEKETSVVPQPSEPARETMPWPDSTFIPEKSDAQHYLGSHWDPFVEDSEEIVKRLPEFLSIELLQTGYGDFYKSPRAIPEEWPKGVEFVWPMHTQGTAMIIRFEEQAAQLVSFFPFFASGSQHSLTLCEVCVWEGGMEAQITASWGDGEVTFFDTRYTINRAWYETGKEYDFILSGIAYSAKPAENPELQINRHPDEVAWLNQRLKEGEEPHEAVCTLHFDGAAWFLPINEWDSDDYSFHAPVKAVEEFKDWLGQDGWRVRATVMRFGDEDADLDIIITQRAWSGNEPPQVGQDIEGQLWLQGYLWASNS
jgi:hypothetical protein